MKKLFNHTIVIDKATGQKIALRSMKLFNAKLHRLPAPQQQAQEVAPAKEVDTDVGTTQETAKETTEADVSTADGQAAGNTTEQQAVAKDAQSEEKTPEQTRAEKEMRFGQLKAAKAWLNGNPNKAEYDALKAELNK